ncbi:MAG: winged helix-turn-helix transcriptional regulator [Exiguobacterium profundum]|nr:MAG: winged helix-turn-helix transcriptional regulator [Exiguobacterium profundum]
MRIHPLAERSPGRRRFPGRGRRGTGRIRHRELPLRPPRAQGDIPQTLIDELGAGLEGSQFHALAAVIRIASGFGRPGPQEVTVGHLADDLLVDASRASRIASDLVDRGLLRRAVSQQDGRRSVLVPTEVSRELLDRFLAAKWNRTIRLFRDWPAEDIVTFARLFARFSAGLREQYPPRG